MPEYATLVSIIDHADIEADPFLVFTDAEGVDYPVTDAIDTLNDLADLGWRAVTQTSFDLELESTATFVSTLLFRETVED